MNAELLSKFPSQKNKTLQWKYEDNIEIFNKYTQYVEKSDIIETKKTNNSIEKTKVEKQNPLEFASTFCIAENDYTKQKLQDFISIKEFQTVFGVKNTTEIMKGIINNKWNKQLIILYSFLFDISFTYLKKEVVFDSNKLYTQKVSI